MVLRRRRGNSIGPRTRSEFGLPALRSLGELKGALPVLRADSREVMPLKFDNLRCVYDQTLPEADYQIAGISDFAIERKGSLDELSGCCMSKSRERFERELDRLLKYSFRRILIVGATCDEDVLSYPYHSNILGKCVLGSLYARQASFGIPFTLTPTTQTAALQIERWAHYWCAYRVKQVNDLLRGCQQVPTG
jgi:hypothetical protein